MSSCFLFLFCGFNSFVLLCLFFFLSLSEGKKRTILIKTTECYFRFYFCFIVLVISINENSNKESIDYQYPSCNTTFTMKGTYVIFDPDISKFSRNVCESINDKDGAKFNTLNVKSRQQYEKFKKKHHDIEEPFGMCYVCVLFLCSFANVLNFFFFCFLWFSFVLSQYTYIQYTI